MTAAADRPVLFEDGTDLRLSEGFTKIPNVVLRSPGLSIGAKVVYGVLLSWAWQDEEAFPGQEAIATAVGKASEKSVRNWLKELAALNLVEPVRRGLGRTNLYVLKEISPVTIAGLYGKSYRSDRQYLPDGSVTGTVAERADFAGPNSVVNKTQVNTTPTERRKPRKRKSPATEKAVEDEVQERPKSLEEMTPPEFKAEQVPKLLTICPNLEKASRYSILGKLLKTHTRRDISTALDNLVNEGLEFGPKALYGIVTSEVQKVATAGVVKRPSRKAAPPSEGNARGLDGYR